MQHQTTKLRTLLLIIVLLPVQPALGRRIEIPRGVFYYQPAASVFGAEAVWVNPAGVARYGTPSFQVMADHLNGDYAKSWGLVTSGERLATAYRKLFNPTGEDYREYALAASMALGDRLYFGASYRYFKDGPDIYDNRHFWNIGLMSNDGRRLSWGAVFSNLNRGKVDGVRTETEQRYSLSYRPIGSKLTVSVDMFLSTKTRLSNADYTYHLEFTPYRGLYLNGFVDSDRNFQLGIRANLLRHFVGGRSSFDRDANHLGSTAFIGATSIRQPSVIREPRRRLSLGISGRTPENPPRPIFGKKQTSLLTILLNIYRAAEDPSIGEMVLSLNRLSLGFGQAQELRDALRYFQSKGKRIICHISSPNNLAYYVGCVADRILIPPVSQLRLVGLRAELTFYAGTLEKLGVRVDFLSVGKYKTAAEAFTRKGATEENREQVNRLLDDLYDQFIDGVAEGRNISRDSVRRIIDSGPFTSVEALEYGLVDGLSYRDEIKKSYLARLPEVSFRRYLSDTLMNDGWRRKPVLAIVVAEGEIVPDRGNPNPLAGRSDVTPSEMAKAFDHASRDRDVEGVVFRINSPGGFALAGAEIHHAAEKAAEKKPTAVSMSSLTASGGYYVAMPATHIFASPATITGSIGIYGGKVDLSGLYKKIDLGKELYTRGRYAGMLSTVRPFLPEERTKYYSHLRAFYDHFVELVAANRELPVDSVDALAGGRVWTGREALSHGLIDELGGIKAALDFCAKSLELEDYEVEILPRKRPFIVLPGSSLLRTIAGILGGDAGPCDRVINRINPLESEELLARIPFDIEIE